MEKTAEYRANAGIKIISDKTARKIIETRGPRGLFVLQEMKIIGIDNSTGDAWTEEFDTYEDCVRWLWHGDKKAHEALEPMHYNYPRIKFVDGSTFFEQLEHVESELREVKRATSEEEQVMELMDLQHSVETAVRIVQERHWINVEECRHKVIEKNRKRGYYDTGNGTAAIERIAGDRYKGMADKMARGE